MLLWGNGQLNAALETQFLNPEYSDTLAQATRMVYQLPLTGSGIIRNMYVTQNIPGTIVGELTYRLEKNAAPTDLAVEMSMTIAEASNLVDVVPVVQGDRLSLVVEGSFGGTGVPPRDVVVTMEYVRTA